MEQDYGSITRRYDMNRMVRTVLTRHRANLEVLTISCSASIVYLGGSLVRSSRQDYKPADVELIFREIERIKMVRGIDADLENWSVSGRGSADWVIVPKKQAQRAGAVEVADHEIESVETLADVLDEIKRGNPAP